MDRKTAIVIAIALLCPLVILGSRALAQTPVGAAFTYQGRLLDADGYSYTGACSMTFELYDEDSGGAQVGASLTFTNVSLYDSYFSVDLDFGSSSYNGDVRWLETQAACPPTATPETFPRSAIRAVPYAVRALNSTSVTSTVYVTNSTYVTSSFYYTPSYHLQGWETITGTPDTYTATVHSHEYVTGTGVAGYAAVWSDSKTIEQATNMIVGGRIAVGTSSPASYSGLHIRKANDAAIHMTDSIVSNSSNSTWLIDVTNGGSGSGGSAVLSIGTTTESGGSYSEKFRISRDGNVTVYGNVSPGAQNTYDLGTSSYYWANVHYHTLVSHSLVDFGTGATLQDGRRVSCTDALAMLRTDSVRSGTGGLQHIDYATIPAAALVASVDSMQKKQFVAEDGSMIEWNEKFSGETGANLDVMVSLVLCASRELDARAQSLATRSSDLEKRVAELERLAGVK